jgi:hypothetical protein
LGVSRKTVSDTYTTGVSLNVDGGFLSAPTFLIGVAGTYE